MIPPCSYKFRLLFSVPSRSWTLNLTTTNCWPTPATSCLRSMRYAIFLLASQGAVSALGTSLSLKYESESVALQVASGSPVPISLFGTETCFAPEQFGFHVTEVSYVWKKHLLHRCLFSLLEKGIPWSWLWVVIWVTSAWTDPESENLVDL